MVDLLGAVADAVDGPVGPVRGRAAEAGHAGAGLAFRVGRGSPGGGQPPEDVVGEALGLGRAGVRLVVDGEDVAGVVIAVVSLGDGSGGLGPDAGVGDAAGGEVIAGAGLEVVVAEVRLILGLRRLAVGGVELVDDVGPDGRQRGLEGVREPGAGVEFRGGLLEDESAGRGVTHALRCAVLVGVLDAGFPGAAQPAAFDARDDVLGGRDLVAGREGVDLPRVGGVDPAGVVVVVSDRLGEQALCGIVGPQGVVLPLGAEHPGGTVVAQGGAAAEDVVAGVQYLADTVGGRLDLAVGVVGRRGGTGIRVLTRDLAALDVVGEGPLVRGGVGDLGQLALAVVRVAGGEVWAVDARRGVVCADLGGAPLVVGVDRGGGATRRRGRQGPVALGDGDGTPLLGEVGVILGGPERRFEGTAGEVVGDPGDRRHAPPGS